MSRSSRRNRRNTRRTFDSIDQRPPAKRTDAAARKVLDILDSLPITNTEGRESR